MKFLFIFLITIHLCVNKNIIEKFIDFINKLIEKKEVKDFAKSIDEKIDYFTKKTSEVQMVIIKDLNNTVQTVIQKLKNEEKEFENNIKTFVKTSIETMNYLTIYNCNKDDNPLECKNNKKSIVSQLMYTIKEEFQCSKIINIITNILSINIEEYINYILYLLKYSTNLHNLIKNSQILILYDIINCLEEKVFDYYWPQFKVILKLGKNKSITFKKDSLKILLKSIYNLINMIYKKDKKEYDKSQIIYTIISNFFTLLKRLNEFGDNFYKIDDSFALNVIVKRDELEKLKDKELFVYNLNNNGIKLILYSNYIFREKKAESIHIMSFNTSLNIFNNTNITQKNDYNPSVIINLYDKDGKEIIFNNISNNFRPLILYNKKYYTDIKQCLNYNDSSHDFNDNNKNLIYSYYDLNGEQYIKCIPKTINYFNLYYSIHKNLSSSNWGFNISFSQIICFFIIICICILCKKRGASKMKYQNDYSKTSKFYIE